MSLVTPAQHSSSQWDSPQMQTFNSSNFAFESPSNGAPHHLGVPGKVEPIIPKTPAFVLGELIHSVVQKFFSGLEWVGSSARGLGSRIDYALRFPEASASRFQKCRGKVNNCRKNLNKCKDDFSVYKQTIGNNSSETPLLDKCIKVYEKVAPLRRNITELNETLKQTQKDLKNCRADQTDETAKSQLNINLLNTTRTELNTTRTELNTTRTELNTTKKTLKEYQYGGLAASLAAFVLLVLNTVLGVFHYKARNKLKLYREDIHRGYDTLSQGETELGRSQEQPS